MQGSRMEHNDIRRADVERGNVRVNGFQSMTPM